VGFETTVVVALQGVEADVEAGVEVDVEVVVERDISHQSSFSFPQESVSSV